MYSLFCEAKFWTLRTDIQIRNTDLGALRYYDKKEIDECPYLEGKKFYSCQRGATFILKNKRPLKLRDNLKELEQQLLNNKIVFYEWKDDSILYLILNTGLIIAIGVNVHSKDIYKITFDRYLIGKLLSENICDVLSTKTHLLISYNENQVSLINFSKPCTKFNIPQKLTKLEPKVQIVDLSGPTGRRLDRRLSSNKSGDMILTWWHSTRNEVYPWSPLVKDEDRANVHIYSLIGNKMELLCFYRTEFDLVSVKFSRLKPNLIRLIEQKVSKKGDVAIEYSSYEVVKKSLKKHFATSVPLQTQICCHSISPDEEKLVLGCIDGTLILFDEPRGVTRLVKTAFIPNLVTWHNDGALIIIANERSQFQFFDLALSCLRAQLLSEDVTPSSIIDLATYFKSQPTLLHMKWNKKLDASTYSDRYISNDGLLALVFENGPLGVLNLIGGGGLMNDVQNSGMTPDTLIRQYLLWNQSDKALNLLLSLNWNTNGSSCLTGLYYIANYVFRSTFTPEKEIQLEAALGSFYSPVRPLTRFTENEFGNQVHDLTRRFFYHLLRYRFYEKAYCLAIDLSDSDLFIDLFHCAKLLQDQEMAVACRSKFEELSHISDSVSHSSCSNSSCSCSSDSDDKGNEDHVILPPLPQVSVKKSKASKVPPLPDLNRHNKLRGSAFFNCSSSYLQPSELPKSVLEVDNPEFSNGLEPETASTSFNEFYPTLLSESSNSFNFGFSNTQILTPEYPHSYEIRTSFSVEETKSNSFNPIKTEGKKLMEDRLIKHNSAFQSLSSGPNIFDNLDISSHLNSSIREPEFLKKEYSHLSELPKNHVGPLRLKSPQVSNPIRFYAPTNATNSYYTSRIGSFDYLLSSPAKPVYIGGRPGLSVNESSSYYSQRNFAPRATTYKPSVKTYGMSNNIMLQRPLQFVPNPQSKSVSKPNNGTGSKQKVKFSDTVTQIVVPDISKISIENETTMSHSKSKDNRNIKSYSSPFTSNSDSVHSVQSQPIQKLENSNFNTSSTDNNDDEENNGTIKVIHFGVV